MAVDPGDVGLTDEPRGIGLIIDPRAFGPSADSKEVRLVIDPRRFGLTRALYSIDDARKILSVGRSKLYKLSREGALPVRKVGEKSVIMAYDIAVMLTHMLADKRRVDSRKGAEMRRARLNATKTPPEATSETQSPTRRRPRRPRKASLVAAE